MSGGRRGGPADLGGQVYDGCEKKRQKRQGESGEPKGNEAAAGTHVCLGGSL